MVAIPERLARRPMWGQYPIPWITASTPDGAPIFRANNEQRRMEALRRRLCGMCGESLDYWLFFICGPGHQKVPIFVEPPQHEACARYVLATCPYFADRKYSVREKPIPDHKLGEARIGHPEIKVDAGPRLEPAGLWRTRSYDMVMVDNMLQARAAPAKEIEWVVDPARGEFL